MGTWDTKPWDNDTAADWFGGVFDETELREKVRAALELDLNEHQEIRAAAHVLMSLGRTYVWPIDQLDSDLALAVERLTEIKKVFQDLPELLAEINFEIEVLKCRLDREHPLPDSEDFHLWWLGLAR